MTQLTPMEERLDQMRFETLASMVPNVVADALPAYFTFDLPLPRKGWEFDEVAALKNARRRNGQGPVVALDGVPL